MGVWVREAWRGGGVGLSVGKGTQVHQVERAAAGVEGSLFLVTGSLTYLCTHPTLTRSPSLTS
jgi:hypothetical protein